MLYEFEEITDVVGCCCTLLIPYRGHSEGYIVGDYTIKNNINLISASE